MPVEVPILNEDKAPPTVLPVAECRALMHAAEGFNDGCLVPYFTMALFLGMRPFECRRLTWEQINFGDREVHIEARQSKVKRARTLRLDETSEAWLRAYRHLPIRPEANFRNVLESFLRSAGYGRPSEEQPDLKPWTKDVLRHTAISHWFRKTHSYGETAERHGNSEKIIKEFYQGRVSSEETTAFYAIRPERKAP